LLLRSAEIKPLLSDLLARAGGSGLILTKTNQKIHSSGTRVSQLSGGRRSAGNAVAALWALLERSGREAVRVSVCCIVALRSVSLVCERCVCVCVC